MWAGAGRLSRERRAAGNLSDPIFRLVSRAQQQFTLKKASKSVGGLQEAQLSLSRDSLLHVFFTFLGASSGPALTTFFFSSSPWSEEKGRHGPKSGDASWPWGAKRDSRPVCQTAPCLSGSVGMWFMLRKQAEMVPRVWAKGKIHPKSLLAVLASSSCRRELDLGFRQT